jgi:hypothetical protein
MAATLSDKTGLVQRGAVFKFTPHNSLGKAPHGNSVLSISGKKLFLRSSRKESVVLQIKRFAPISGSPRIGQELI